MVEEEDSARGKPRGVITRCACTRDRWCSQLVNCQNVNRKHGVYLSNFHALVGASRIDETRKTRGRSLIDRARRRQSIVDRLETRDDTRSFVQ